MNYSHLKSGTDIRGVASPLGGRNVELTSKAVYDISCAFAVWCAKRCEKTCTKLKIALGHDSRITADEISEVVKRAFVGSGVTVFDCGLASTPAMFMTTIDLGADAAIQITASHHPFDRNGLKFFLSSGGLNGSEISEILDMASNNQCCENNGGSIIAIDYMNDYAAMLRQMIISAVNKGEKPLVGCHFVVDAGNGVGGFYATEVLKPLGADISGSQFLEPDGMFPNHIPNPENEQAMESICSAVMRSGADLGIIFDTDVDRAGCVGEDGREINRNRLIALAARIALADNPGGTVVTDSVASDGLKNYIEKNLGGIHYRYRRGYKNVIDKAIELCNEGINCPLAIETSGHAALRENYFLDDGAYLITKIVIEAARGTDFNEILLPLKMPAEEKEFRFEIIKDDFSSYGEQVINELCRFVKEIPDYQIADDNREGIRVSTPGGWFLLRNSVHDPVMVLNLESDVAGGTEKDIIVLRSFFSNLSYLKMPENF